MAIKLRIGQDLKCMMLSIAISLLITLGALGPQVASAGTIAQTPLFVALGGTEPNLLFMLDDSGSMMFEVMPDAYIYWNQTNGSVAYLFPRANNVYWSTDYPNNVATINDSIAYTALMRSPDVNTLYYNPAITYTPWKKYDGSSYPDASPTCAYHNPANSGAGCRNLTINLQNTGTTNWQSCDASSCYATTTTLPNSTFLTATYYRYNNLGLWVRSNYTKHEIRPSITSYSGEGRSSRTDCSGGVCTYNEEIQNFANWYSYYRSRSFAARAGIGQAFADLDESVRVGFGAINEPSNSVDGVTTKAVIQGVRPFSMTNRQTFYDLLYTHPNPAEGTPLRLALDAAGQYFSRADGEGPWADTPGASSALSSGCRQSYTVLMTDGYWTGGTGYEAETTDARDDNDSTNGPTITGPNSQTFTYSAVSPFSDSRANTLADVAMYYWKRDLIGTLTNRVPTTTLDPAFWQHMVTFGVGMGVTGSVTPSDAFDAITTGAAITWPDPDTTQGACVGSQCPARIDDLLHASVNSRGGFFSAADPGSFATNLESIIQDIVARASSSAAALSANSTSAGTDTRIFQAKFDSSDWSGRLLAYQLDANGDIVDPDNDGNIEEDAEWDTDTPGKIPAPASRSIYSRIGAANVELDWTALTAAQQTTLNGYGIDQDILDWIRGDQSNEQPSGSLRARSYILGDIANSSPAYVGSLNFGYEYLPTSTLGRSTYFAFKVANQTRTTMLYVGANDGMLHGFDATTGVERFAYVPNVVLPNLASLSDPNYTHHYFVDGSPQAGDAYFGGTWKTVLVGTTGAGGKAVFALDITNPSSFDQTKILWEYSDTDLGYPVNQLVQPVIGRMQNGEWAVVFGNGYESTNDRAMLYVVRLSDGALIAKIDTQAGNASDPNGLAGPVLVADTHRTIQYAYAGDRLGNLWKFDLSSTNPAAWHVAFDNAGTPMPLFRARYVSGGVETPQPITAAPEIGEHPDGGYMLYFGTGKFFEVGDNSDTSVQSLYGIWDKNDGNSTSYVTQTDRSTLQRQEILNEQTITDTNGDTHTWRVSSDNSVTWSGANPQRGWYLDLLPPGTTPEGERVVSVPLLRHGRAIFTTMIPSTDVCDAGGTSWILELDMISGGRLSESVFDVNGDGQFNASDFAALAGGSNVAVSGIQSDVGIISTPTVIETTGQPEESKFASGSTGAVTRIREKGASDGGRQSWRQLR